MLWKTRLGPREVRRRRSLCRQRSHPHAGERGEPRVRVWLRHDARHAATAPYGAGTATCVESSGAAAGGGDGRRLRGCPRSVILAAPRVSGAKIRSQRKGRRPQVGRKADRRPALGAARATETAAPRRWGRRRRGPGLSPCGLRSIAGRGAAPVRAALWLTGPQTRRGPALRSLGLAGAGGGRRRPVPRADPPPRPAALQAGSVCSPVASRRLTNKTTRKAAEDRRGTKP